MGLLNLGNRGHKRRHCFSAGVVIPAMAIGLLVAILPSVPSYGLSPNPITISNYYGGNQAFDPNTGGTISGSYCLSDAANVTITVANASDTVVRTIQSGVSEPAGCNYYNPWYWDGTDDNGAVVPDGIYTITVEAVDANGSTASTSYQDQVMTQPIGQLTAPTDGQTVSGNVSYTFVPNPAYTVTAVDFPCVQGAEQTDGSWQATTSSSSCFANGANTVSASVTWTNAFGGSESTTSPSVPITVSNPITISNYYGGNQAFNPNTGASVEGSYCLSDAANVTITVANASDTVVRTIQSGVSEPAGCNYYNPWYWDGTDDNGAVVPDGIYTITVEAVDANGSTASTSYQDQVMTQPIGQLTAPTDGQTVSGNVSYTFVPNPAYTVTAVDFPCVQGAEQTDGSWQATTSSSSCFANGANTVSASVTWTNAFGGSESTTSPSVPITVSNFIPITISNYYGGNQAFNPNTGGTISGSYCLSDAANVTITVANASDTVVRTIQSGVSEPAGCNYYNPWYWDGTDDNGAVVPDGIYTITVEAVDANGSTASTSYQDQVMTQPIGQLTAPTDGQTVSGNVSYTFVPNPAYTVTAVDFPCVQGAEQTDGSWQATTSSSSCFANGANTVSASVTWTNAFGGSESTTSPSVPITVSNFIPITISNYYGGNQAFNPNTGASVEGSYCLSDAANVTITVANASDTVVRTIQSGVSEPAGCNYYNPWYWDGTDDNGAVVPDGIYTITVEAVDANGSTASTSYQDQVMTQPIGQLTAPTDGQTVSGNVSYTFVPNPAYTVTAVDFPCVQGAEQTDGSWQATTSSSSCFANGANTVSASVTWTNAFGGSESTTSPSVPITVSNPITISNYYGGNQAFNPNTGASVEGSYCLSDAANVTITVANASDTVVRTIQSGVSEPAGCNYYNPWYWDGTDDNGAVVPDGIYTITVEAVDANGSTASTSYQDQVWNPQPGSLVNPTANASLAGLIPIAFQPSSGVELQQVQVCFDPGPCADIYGASPDGDWRTSILASSLTTGPAEVTTSTNILDAFGQAQSIGLGSIPVTVNSTAVPLTFSASPNSGQIPLATTFTVSASDPNGLPLSYSIQFGDGQSTSGTLDDPYPDLTIADTYGTSGTYYASIEVSDGAGGAATATTTINALPPTTPLSASLQVVPSSGFAPLTTQIQIGTAAPTGEDLTYLVNFGDGTQSSSGTIPAGAIAHTYTQTGDYTVQLSVSNGTQTATASAQVTVTAAPAVVAEAGDPQTASVGSPVNFSGAGSYPSSDISRYQWNFGDGSTGSGEFPQHHYSTAGTYTASLTVTGAGGSATGTTTIIVVAPQPSLGLRVQVNDQNGNPLSGAIAEIIEGDGTRLSASSDANGLAFIQNVPDGTYTVYVYQTNYLPTTTTATISGGVGSVTVALTQGSLVQTSLTSTRLTEPQIVAAGIDPNDPANQNIYQFTINLYFGPTPITLSGYTSSTGGGGGGEGGGFVGGTTYTAGGGGGGGGACSGTCPIPLPGGATAIASVAYPGGEPELMWLIIPGQAEFLKEFFNVQLVVSNLANSAFTLSDVHATLSVPGGMSLAPTAVPQSVSATLPNIPGGQSESTSWILRGDQEGYYDLSADISALLQPLGISVAMEADSTSPLHVWGGSAVSMTVNVDDSESQGYPYHVSIGLTNVSDIPVYNVSAQLLTQGMVNYIYQPDQQLTYTDAELDPGQTFWTPDYILVPTIPSTDVPNPLNLGQSFVAQTAGNVSLQSTIIDHPAVDPPSIAPTISASPTSGDVVLNWQPVSGASEYEIFGTPSDTTPFPADPIMTVDGSQTSAIVPNDNTNEATYYAVSSVINGVPTMEHPLVSSLPNCSMASLINVKACLRIANDWWTGLADPANRAPDFVIVTAGAGVGKVGINAGIAISRDGNEYATAGIS